MAEMDGDRRRAVKTTIRNIGTIVTGDISSPLADGDAIVVLDGKVHQVGREADVDTGDSDTVVDAKGTTVIPGLIDSHFHPSFGNFDPRQGAIGYIEAEVHGGVTTMISAGEVHVPGRPRDITGLKAMAIAAKKSYDNYHPAGAKVHAGAPILELGMVEEDFAEMARAGVRLIGEIGLGSVSTGKDAAPMVRWAKKYGMIATIHTGGPSPAAAKPVPIDADTVLETQPHTVGHINCGTASMSERDIDRLVDTDMALEIVHCGNLKTALHTIRSAMDAGALDRVILGNDAPTGIGGIVPTGLLWTMSHLAGLAGLDPALAVCCATGNTARLHSLPIGLIEPGKTADLVIVDTPIGSVARDALAALAAGDLLAVSTVIIDGEIRVGRSRNTPPALRRRK